jgi:hypothetical protein
MAGSAVDDTEDQITLIPARHVIRRRRKGTSVVRLAQEQLEDVEREKTRRTMDPAYRALADRMELHAAVSAAAREAVRKRRNLRAMLFLTSLLLVIGVMLAVIKV